MIRILGTTNDRENRHWKSCLIMLIILIHLEILGFAPLVKINRQNDRLQVS